MIQFYKRDMKTTNKAILFLLFGLLLLSRSDCTKKVDCRKYVFAPVCRGASKRDLQKLEPLFEEPRKPRYMPTEEKFINGDSFRSSNENNIYDKTFLDTFIRKLNTRNNEDYDTGTDC